MEEEDMWLKKKASRVAVAWLGSIATAFSLTALSGCTEKTSEPKSLETGVILEVTENGAYVVSEGIGSATYIQFNDPNWQDAAGKSIDTSDLFPGQQVQYDYTSRLETWPASLLGCDKVTLTGETQDVTALLEEWNKVQADLSSDAEKDEMPSLQVSWQDGKTAACILPIRGTSSWTTEESGICQDSPCPLYWNEDHLVSASVKTGSTVSLTVTGMNRTPDTLTLIRWDESESDSSSVPDGETIKLEKGSTFSAKTGGIYELTAVWNDGIPHGSVSWGFKLDPHQA